MKGLNIALIALSVFILSGCGGGGGGGSSSFVNNGPEISPNIVKVAVINSPALERNKRYRMYKGASLSGINGAVYYVSNTGSEAVQSVLVLGFSEELRPDESLIIVNEAPDSSDHSGSVVFAYNPLGSKRTFSSGGNVSFSGGTLMKYRSLSLSEEAGSANDIAGHYNINPEDAEIFSLYESDRGITTFAVGEGRSLSFVPYDEETNSQRDIPSSGNTLRLVRKINTFSDIVRNNYYY